MAPSCAKPMEEEEEEQEEEEDEGSQRGTKHRAERWLGGGGAQIGSDLSGRLDDVEQGDVVEHLVPVVPGVEDPLPRVVVQHGDVRVLVVEGDVRVFVARGGRVVSEVDFGSCQVGVGDVQSPADEERFPRAAFRVTRVPAPQHLFESQCEMVQIPAGSMTGRGVSRRWRGAGGYLGGLWGVLGGDMRYLGGVTGCWGGLWGIWGGYGGC